MRKIVSHKCEKRKIHIFTTFEHFQEVRVIYLLQSRYDLATARRESSRSVQIPRCAPLEPAWIVFFGSRWCQNGARIVPHMHW